MDSKNTLRSAVAGVALATLASGCAQNAEDCFKSGVLCGKPAGVVLKVEDAGYTQSCDQGVNRECVHMIVTVQEATSSGALRCMVDTSYGQEYMKTGDDLGVSCDDYEAEPADVCSDDPEEARYNGGEQVLSYYYCTGDPMRFLSESIPVTCATVDPCTEMCDGYVTFQADVIDPDTCGPVTDPETDEIATVETDTFRIYPNYGCNGR